ncbi:hypothetical protein C2G38_562380 [Gigaspora rosea]|uniref:TLD-domain-containing protein n=1 Tax=Gigaspora rosea TaxID=44941 RepID=A0A397U9X5_9GLOM|nr:hypothetical protein C2G38_562380 [Gigaspora rosea]
MKKFKVHSLILRTRSSYFRSAFSKDWAERNDNGYLIFQKPNISSLVFGMILEYLYCGIVDFQGQKNNEIILELLIAADELGIQKLVNSVQEFLSQNRSKFLQSNFIKMFELIATYKVFDNLKKDFLEIFVKNCKHFLRQDPIKILHFIIHHEEFNKYWKVVLEAICETPTLLFESNNFRSLEKDVLTMILKCDDLNMKESEIWKRLIKWGIAQNLTLRRIRRDVTKFTHEEFMILEQTLHELIQIVRFHQMNREEFMSEVWPLRYLLPDNLIEDILSSYLIPGAIPHYNTFPVRWGNFKIDSAFINKEAALLFTKWIDKKDVGVKSSKKIQYKFNLLFRSSIDGLSAQVFHHRCDNKGATIVIAKISNSNMLVGGYNPRDWRGQSYKFAFDSFIFSISDLNDLQSAKLGHVIDGHKAIRCSNNYGPNFHDLYAPNNSNNWQYTRDSYANIGITNSFVISGYEVFQVVKN